MNKQEILMALESTLNATEHSDSTAFGRAVALIIELDKLNTATAKTPAAGRKQTNTDVAELGVKFKSLNNIRSLARFENLDKFTAAGYSYQQVLKLKQFKTVEECTAAGYSPNMRLTDIMQRIASKNAEKSAPLDKYDSLLKHARRIFDGSDDTITILEQRLNEQRERDIEAAAEQQRAALAAINEQIAALQRQAAKLGG